MLNFYDFEVFKMDWLVVIINPIDQTETVIVNDPDTLRDYYNSHKEEIWIGYNSRRYDQYILKAILCGFDPKKVNDWIIVEDRQGWMFSNLLRKYPLNNYDVMTSFHGLKQLEGFMGNNIKETSVPFDLNRKLTAEEIAETIKYCKHDVEQTMEVFLERKADFDAHMSLIKTFDLPLNYITKTKAQLSATILQCEKTKYDDEWNITFVDTLRLEKYKHIMDWYKNPLNRNYDKVLEVMVAGVPHVFGWGGLHGAIEKYHGTGLIVHVDVTSYYPSLMIIYNLLTRSCKHPELFKQIYDKRVALKKAGKKKEQAPYKIILNGTFGICKDKMNPAYDPLQANNICINGQLLLLDLIEHLEVIDGFELIQSNTDGLIVKIPNSQKAFDELDDICFEWEQRTHMGLGFDYIKEIYQKDVNNYLFIQDDGYVETKGAYVKSLNNLDYDLPIINKALVDYMVKKVPIEKTINECDSLKDFQKIIKISSKYLKGLKGYDPVKNISRIKKIVTYTDSRFEELNDKTFRVFASNSESDGAIYKLKTINSKAEKFANTPERCFIENGDINNMKIPSKLDKQWYIDLAYKRLNDFGIEGGQNE